MLSVLLALSGPAQAQTERPADDPHQAVAEFLPSCAPRFAQIDARVAEAGVGDASYRRVEGFPYLRTDRLMSSYDRELDDPDKLDAWLLQLRDNDNFSRDIELRNLGLDTRERSTLLLDMRLCAVWLSFMETGDPERLRAMIRAVRKTAEAAPSAAPPEHADAAASGRATQRVWRAAANDEARELLERFARLPRDPLRRTGLTVDGWLALATEFAPTWIIGSGRGNATPAALAWRDTHLVADTARPTVYFMPAFARAGETVLMQFHYFVWFAGADGDIDGVIWRVTLDENGRPLLYDSLGADGSGYRIHRAQALEVRHPRTLAAGVIAEDVLGTGPLRVHVDADTAAVTAVEPGEPVSETAVATTARDYALVAYEELLVLPRGEGTMSAFDASGRLRVSSGHPALQLGRHPPLAPLQRTFDDPRLVEAYFLLPPDMAPERVAGNQVIRP